MTEWYSSEEWGRPPLDPYPGAMAGYSGLVSHHTVTANVYDRTDVLRILREIDSYHRRRGWSGIGYSWIIDRFGRVWEGRGWGVVGSHTVGLNRYWHGVALLGDGRVTPTSEAVTAWWDVHAAAERLYGPQRRVGHRDVRTTACPGDEWYTATILSPQPSPQPRRFNVITRYPYPDVPLGPDGRSDWISAPTDADNIVSVSPRRSGTHPVSHERSLDGRWSVVGGPPNQTVDVWLWVAS